MEKPRPKAIWGKITAQLVPSKPKSRTLQNNGKIAVAKGNINPNKK